MQPVPPSPVASLIPVLAIFAIFYFLLIRPQQKRQKEHDKMLAALKKGDRVLLNGGLYGTIVGIRGQELELKIADNVKVAAARASVQSLASAGAEEPAAAAQA